MQLDENLYSRQLYVLGTDAMKDLQTSRVLILGLSGLGQEVSKNIILAGVSEVFIYDPSPVLESDLGTGYYFRTSDISRRRDFSVLKSLRELNPYVSVNVLNKNEIDLLTCVSQNSFSLVVCCNFPIDFVIKLSRLDLPFIFCEVDGLFSRVFVDFKKGFLVKDDNGEPCVEGIFNDVSENGIMTLIDGERHGLEDGNMLKIRKPEKNDENKMNNHNNSKSNGNNIKNKHSSNTKDKNNEPNFTSNQNFKDTCDQNGKSPNSINKNNSGTIQHNFKSEDEEIKSYSVEIINSNSLRLKNYTGDFILGGTYEQIKVPRIINFLPLEEANKDPKILESGDMEKLKKIHKLYLMKDSNDLNNDHNSFSEFFCINLGIEIMPMVSIIGGFVAQEVLKGCTGKFTPLNQFLYFESIDTLNYIKNTIDIDKSGCKSIIDDKINSDNGNNKSETDNINHEHNGESDKSNNNGWIDDYVSYYKSDLSNFEITCDYDLRYENQIKLFGKKIFKYFQDSTLFIVGAGAIGCEHLKNIVMSGIGEKAKIHVTDMDSIEQSNLNRQFLFRQRDVGKMKSETAVNQIVKMNQRYKKIDTFKSKTELIDVNNKRKKSDEIAEASILSYTIKVGSDTEDVFSDRFISSCTLIANALDNIEARKYIDSRSILCKIPLFESGTLGTKGNTQVILPNKTESYSSTNDPPEKSIPLCTLRNFPNLIEHTIEYALNEFKNSFCDKIISLKDYLKMLNNTNENKMNSHDKNNIKEMNISVESIKQENIGEDIIEMTKYIPKSKSECIRNSFYLFYKIFYINVFKLLNAFPPNHLTKEGLPFWNPPRRPPVTIEFDLNDELHILFIKSSSNLFKYCFSVEGDKIGDNEIFKAWNEMNGKVINDIENKITEIRNKIDSENENNEDEILKKEISIEDDVHIKSINNDYEINTTNVESDCINNTNSNENNFNGIKIDSLKPVEFEKDDDTNHHIDFIHACANIRARNYRIKEATRFQVKGISGRIIPAIATTTALVSGLTTLEIYKYIIQKNYSELKNKDFKIDVFKNSFITLALPFIAQSDPVEPEKQKYNFDNDDVKKEKSYNLWDRIELKDMKLNEFIQYFKNEHNVNVEMVICSGKVIFSTFYNQKEFKNNLDKKFTEIEKVSNGKKYLVIECMFDCVCETFPFITIKVE